MTLAAAAMLKLDHLHGRLSRSRETNGICAEVRTTSEDGPSKYRTRKLKNDKTTSSIRTDPNKISDYSGKGSLKSNKTTWIVRTDSNKILDYPIQARAIKLDRERLSLTRTRTLFSG
ncbi:hypothetical protein KIN20_006644 [Parelaphostrongylus tenuis]|uniref:Uncharacterized protein n=1 Tax=Parelaphostrongylus tenuis TaxID=148309 RepID=A0AAD5MKF1_PARTN|nr:hypothetical protein KIN20_006644 [Parelaphostrongylus tenuis]